MEDLDKLANEALVFMAVGLGGRWKFPVAYFFTDHTTAYIQTNLVTDCIKRLYEVGITVRAVTCDGTEVNFCMFKNFRVTIDNCYFDHPSCPDVKIFAVPDVCHMIKLVRYTLGDLKIIADNEGKQIRWQHVTDLVEMQESMGLRAANKLSVRHIDYCKHKMKVKLAAQVLSSSVADALDFLRLDCKDLKQAGNDATVKFIRIIDHPFDVLNSHSPIAHGYKSALRANNMQFWTEGPSKYRDYIAGLKCADGELIKSRPHRVVFFYSKIRSRGGFNNNPSVTQFTAAYRSLIVKNSVTPSLNANCVALDNDDGYITIGRRRKTSSSSDDSDASVCVVENYIDAVSQNTCLSNCLYYISGFVTRSVSRTLSCEDCCLALNEKILDVPESSACFLVNRKNRGGLFSPSGSVLKVITTNENVISHEILCLSALSNFQYPRLQI
jgi:hypothetical protein